jgi:hypothetical protein
MDAATVVESVHSATVGSDVQDDVERGVAMTSVGASGAHKYEEIVDAGVISAKRS